MVLKVTLWGHPHWCREIWNSWLRCWNQDPGMRINAPHCWKQQADYQECLKGVKDVTAQRLFCKWAQTLFQREISSSCKIKNWIKKICWVPGKKKLSSPPAFERKAKDSNLTLAWLDRLFESKKTVRL